MLVSACVCVCVCTRAYDKYIKFAILNTMCININVDQFGLYFEYALIDLLWGLSRPRQFVSHTVPFIDSIFTYDNFALRLNTNNAEHEYYVYAYVYLRLPQLTRSDRFECTGRAIEKCKTDPQKSRK